MSEERGKLEKYTHVLSAWFNWVAGIAVLGMLGLVVSDILGVKLFNSPVPGAIELVGYLGVIVVACAIAHTLVVRGHIQIDFFIVRLPPHVRAGVQAAVYLLSFVLFAVIGWQSYEFGRVLQRTGEVSMTQRIPFYPFVYAIALSCIPVCLVILIGLVKSVRKAVRS